MGKKGLLSNVENSSFLFTLSPLFNFLQLLLNSAASTTARKKNILQSEMQG